MKTIAFALRSLIVGLAMLACQPRTRTRTEYVNVEVPFKEKDYEFAQESWGEPIDVPAYDPSCHEQRGLGLRSDLIADAFIGIETVRTSTTIQESLWEDAMEKAITRQTFETEYISRGRSVALCRDASTIPINTQEGAASRMKADADSAYGLYQSVQNKAGITLPELEPIHLHAAVKAKLIDRTVSVDGKAREETEYQTDNAVFMVGSKPTMISYPQSQHSLKFKLLGGVPLWAIKGVFQHEFGHFIFFTLINDGQASFPTYQAHAAGHPDLHLFQTPASTLARLARRPALRASFTAFAKSQDFFMGSLNEGFADLWAYYALKQPPDLFEISCFAKNRNPVSPVFFNGLSKSWDETLWNKIFSDSLDEARQDQPTPPLEACSQPLFSDIHIIGAIMAHTADAVFSMTVRARSLEDSSLLKAEMSLAWLQALRAADEFDDLGGRASLSRIMNTALGISIASLQGADKTGLCNTVTSKFPALVKRWKDARTDNEDISGVVRFCSL